MFQLHGLSRVELPSGFVRQGPFSDTAWSALPEPGPPLTQRAKGAVSALLRLSKNQKNRFWGKGCKGVGGMEM